MERFNDFRSWPIAHRDERRILYEKELPSGIVLTGFEIIGDVLPLGNHYHKRKVEIFYLLSGSARWTLQVVPQNGVGPPPYVVDAVIGAAFAVVPYVAHAVQLAPGSTMACINTEKFDPDDLIPFKLL